MFTVGYSRVARFPVPSKKINIFITIFVPQTHHTLSEFSTIRTIKPMDDPTSDDGATDEIYGKILVQYSEKSSLMEEIFRILSSQILSRENLSSHSTRS